jgi:hypothetical protein
MISKKFGSGDLKKLHPHQHAPIGFPSYDPNCSTDQFPSWAAFQDFYVTRGIQQQSVDMTP